MNTTLVVMAAGLASRYGGNKQIAGMGPHGEILLEYSVCDAIRAGFSRVVFVIRPDMLEAMRRICAQRIEGRIGVRYAFQDFSSLPEWFALPADRVKPYGTVHAVLCAEPEIDGPFAVINADDFYGADAFARMRGFLVDHAAPGRAAMVGYRLKNTVSAHGAVTRGLCRVDGGRLVDVDEVQKIRLFPDGRIADTSAGEPGRALPPEAPVSMNFWGFHPALFADMRRAFEGFLRAARPGDPRAEYQLPVLVGALLRQGRLRVDVLETDAVWFGVTYQEDRPLVQRALRELHESGVYGDAL